MKVPFCKLTPQEQRDEISKYIRKFPVQRGLIGEAIHEHESSNLIIDSFLNGHSTLFGSLADKAIRDYFSTIIESDKMWRIEE